MTAFPYGGPWCRLFASYVKQISAPLLGLLLTLSFVHGQDPATVGQWSALMTWPYTAVHPHVLPTGKVIFWPAFDKGDNPQLWDPQTRCRTPPCGGLAFRVRSKEVRSRAAEATGRLIF